MTTSRVSALIATTAVLLILAGSSVYGQSGGSIFLAVDPGAISRELYDTPGVATIYIVHQGFQAGAQFSGVRFKIDNNGFTGTWLGDWTSLVSVGNSQTGISVGYAGCQQPPISVLSVTYFCAGTSRCTTVTLAPDPSSGFGIIESYNCEGALLSPPYVYDLCVNGVLVPDDTGFGYCDCPVPTEQTTWGGIKAVYDGRAD